MKIDYSYGSFKLEAEDVRDEYYLAELLNMMDKNNAKTLSPYLIIEDAEGGDEKYIDSIKFEKAKKSDMSYFIIKSIEIGLGGLKLV